MLQVLDLFSGIGGFSLGLERAGMRTVAFCEIDPFCRRVLAKHWPGVPCYDDVRELTAARLAADGIAVDVIAGGFPCQDVSFAGKRAGLEGTRSGLWGEYRRLIGELRPSFIIVENVPGLLSLGMGTVLGDLAALRYDAVWECIPACAVSAPHQRDRVWLVAHASGAGRQQITRSTSGYEGANEGRPTPHHHVATSHGEGNGAAHMADAARYRRTPEGEWPEAGYVNRGHQLQLQPGTNWDVEPDVGRVANGVPARLDRLRSLGNAVIPQVVEMIGRAIIATA